MPSQAIEVWTNYVTSAQRIQQLSPDLILSTQRPVPLVARKDVRVHEVVYQGEVLWVIKDPVKLTYFRLRGDQYEILRLLDGKKSIDEIRSCFLKMFPTKHPTRAQIQKMIMDLYEKGLAWSQRPGQGSVLNHRGEVHKWQKAKQAVCNILFIRIPGYDPTRLLSSGYWFAKWIFHPAVLLWAITIIMCSWVVIATHASDFSQRIPSFETFATWKITVFIWIVLGATKIIHELGHAFACRHFGGECHEIGMAFLIFSPCLYCDVSDSWMLGSKWKRIAIAGAGIYVELLLASLAFFVWWNTLPGNLNQICFLIFMVSNISTLLFNLNPFLRLDGYYILSDFLEIPNLRQKSDTVFRNALLWVLAGIESEIDPSLPTKRQGLLIAYAVASIIYRALLLFVVCGILFSMLKLCGLEYVGLAVGLLACAVGSFSWGRRICKSAVFHRVENGQKSVRPFVVGLWAIGLIGVFLFLPIPISSKAPLQIEYSNTQHLYANTPGQLGTVYVQPGQSVRKGQVLLELANEQKTNRLHNLLTAREVQAIELRKQKALVDAKQLTIANENFNSIEKEILDQRDQLNRLRILAPCDGKIIEPRAKRAPLPTKDELPSWQGTPLEMVNAGCYLDVGTHLLSVAPARQFQAIIVVSQFDVHAIRIGQDVRIRLDPIPQKTFKGKIEQVSSAAMSMDHASHDVADSKSGLQNPYHAIVRIEGEDPCLVPGIQGTAKISINTQTVAEWIWRNVCGTFNFQM